MLIIMGVFLLGVITASVVIEFLICNAMDAIPRTNDDFIFY